MKPLPGNQNPHHIASKWASTEETLEFAMQKDETTFLLERPSSFSFHADLWLCLYMQCMYVCKYIYIYIAM